MKIKTDEKVIKQGEITVVKSSTNILASKTFEDAFGELLYKEAQLYCEGVESTGVAKTHPEDKYDEITGLKIASMKAEYKNNKKLLNKLEALRGSLVNLITEILVTEGRLESRNDLLEDMLHSF